MTDLTNTTAANPPGPLPAAVVPDTTPASQDEQTPLAPPTTTPEAPPAAATAQTDPPKRSILARTAAGVFPPSLFSGRPADAVTRFILSRAGIPTTEPAYAGLADIRLDDTSTDVMRVPEVFPPAGYDKSLVSVADWLACVDACKAVPAPPPTDDQAKDAG